MKKVSRRKFVKYVAGAVVAAGVAGAAYQFVATPTTPTKTVTTTSVKPEPPRIMKIRLLYDWNTADPAFLAQGQEYGIFTNVYDCLMKYKPGTVVMEPGLAERWDASSDGLTHTFYLRKGVQWHKGYGEVKASDVKFSFDRLLDPAVNSIHRKTIEIIEKIEVVDDYTVRFKAKSFHPDFLFLLAPYRYSFIINQKVVEKFGKDFGHAPESIVGTGPFDVVETILKDKVVGARNTKYWGKVPWLERVEWVRIAEEATSYMALEKDEIQAMYVTMGDFYAKAKANPKLSLDSIATSGVYAVGMHWEHPIVGQKNPKVRQAIAHAIDKKAIIQGLHKGMETEAFGFCSPYAIAGAISDPKELPQYPYDVQKAKRLLAEAGYPNGFKIDYVGQNTDPWMSNDTAIIAMLKEIGIDIERKMVMITEYNDLTLWGKFGLCQTSHAPRPPAMGIFLGLTAITAASKPGFNYSAYSGIDDLYAMAMKEMDPSKRNELWKKCQIKMMEDVYVVPVYNRTMNVFTQKYVKGWKTGAIWAHAEGLENVYYEPWPPAT